jgi:hydroxymethylpyrimidine/phosphomethylpyrimidine kinase
VDAVKIGMLHEPGVVEVVAWAIEHYQLPHVVLDPVMVATSGDRLIADDTVRVLVERLFPLARVITPNLDEASLLLERPIRSVDELSAAAHALLAQGAQAVLLKGGHLSGEQVVDVLARNGQGDVVLSSPRMASRNTHGTGCTLSSAIAAHLAVGQSLVESVRCARAYILSAIQAGARVQVGHGHGPLNHGHAPVATRVL